MRTFAEFWSSESGQDLTEYALLLAFVVVTSAALLTVSQESITSLWTRTNDNLTTAHDFVER